MERYKKDLISIIIPVYNAEGHLKTCLESVINQSFSQFEIILVDDGSTDNSEKIYRYYEQNDSRVRVIKQQNRGVSYARNKGIDNAQGEYILFLDADDEIKENMLMSMHNAMENHKSEVIFCGFEVRGSSLRKNDTHVLKLCTLNKNSVISSAEAIKRTLSTNPNEQLYGYVWRNLFSSKVIKDNNIRFSNGVKISEDFMFIVEVLDKSNVISIIPEELYIYNINESSVTTKYIDTLHEDMNYINQWIAKTICNKYPEVLYGYHCCVANTYLGFIQNLCRKGNPYNLIHRIKLAYKIKKQYKYNRILSEVWKDKYSFRKKAWIAIVMFYFNLEFLYLILFSIKENKIRLFK